MPLRLQPCELVHIIQQMPVAYVNRLDPRVARPVHDNELKKERKKKLSDKLLPLLKSDNNEKKKSQQLSVATIWDATIEKISKTMKHA